MSYFSIKFFESLKQSYIKKGKILKFLNKKKFFLKILKKIVIYLKCFLNKNKVLTILNKNFFENKYIFFYKNLLFKNLKLFSEKIIYKRKILYSIKKKNLFKIIPNIKKKKDFSNIFFFNNILLKKKKKFQSFNSIFISFEKWKYLNFVMTNIYAQKQHTYYNLKQTYNLKVNRFIFNNIFLNINFYDKNYTMNYFFEKILKKFFFPFKIYQVNFKTPSGHKKAIMKFKIQKNRNFFFNLFKLLEQNYKTKKKKEKFSKNFGYNQKIKAFNKNDKFFFNKFKNNFNDIEFLNDSLFNTLNIEKKTDFEISAKTDKKNKFFLFNKYKFQVIKVMKNKNIIFSKKNKNIKPFPWILKI